jgi:hypothetical protein
LLRRGSTSPQGQGRATQKVCQRRRGRVRASLMTAWHVFLRQPSSCRRRVYRLVLDCRPWEPRIRQHHHGLDRLAL